MFTHKTCSNTKKCCTGLAWCPRLTFLNLYNNDLHDLTGIDTLTALMHINLASNDLKYITGLDKCTQLREVDLSSNDLVDAETLKAMATSCPHLLRIDLSNNNLTSAQVSNQLYLGEGARAVPYQQLIMDVLSVSTQISDIRKVFSEQAPRCKLITDGGGGSGGGSSGRRSSSKCSIM